MGPDMVVVMHPVSHSLLHLCKGEEGVHIETSQSGPSQLLSPRGSEKRVCEVTVHCPALILLKIGFKWLMSEELLPPNRRQVSDIRRFRDRDPLKHINKIGIGIDPV
jgi:hypothetical protein